jgi:hypothetical protein
VLQVCRQATPKVNRTERLLVRCNALLGGGGLEAHESGLHLYGYRCPHLGCALRIRLLREESLRVDDVGLRALDEGDYFGTLALRDVERFPSNYSRRPTDWQFSCAQQRCPPTLGHGARR